MPSLRDIKNHIKGVSATGKLAEAMKSSSAAKYYRAVAVYNAFAPYAAHSASMLGTLGNPFGERKYSGKKCYAVLTGNRGLCGGYNTGLMSFFEEIYKHESDPIVVVCGKWGAEYFQAKGIPCAERFAFRDIPEYDESALLTDYLTKLYSEEKADQILIVHQKFKNILTQTPETTVFLPAKSENEAKDRSGEVIYYPDKEAAGKALYALCLKNRLYSLLLESASGVQAATMMAMRTASDNAAELKSKLELKLNRKRQGQVTSGVIETSSSNEA